MNPIPDEVLRRLADTHIVRYLSDPGEEDDGVLLGRTMLKHLDDCVKGGFYFEVCDEAAAGLRCDLRDMARELLALREAARFAWGGLKDIEEGRDGPGEKWCAEACRNIEDLLPRSPRDLR